MSVVAIFFVLSAVFCGGFFNYKTDLTSADSATYWTDYAATKFAGGSGDSDDPYQISNARELAYLAKYTNNGGFSSYNYRYYKITKPIVLSEHYWVPIGSGLSKAFYGEIDCNNKPIIGLNVNGNYEYAGLFGLVDSLIIKNAIITDARINATGEIGSAGIIAGSVNYASGNLKVLSTQVSGSVTSAALPNAIDGVGGLVGSIRNTNAANCMFENVYSKVTVSAPNRSTYLCTGIIAGTTGVNLTLGTNINNFVTQTTMSGKDWNATNNLYYGEFGYTHSTWFYYEGLQGGVPQIKSHYYIGNNFDYTSYGILTQLKAKNFTAATTIESFIPKVTKYVLTLKTEATNSSTRTGFACGAQSRSGFPNAVKGERVTLSNTTISGYSFDHYKVEYTLGGNAVSENVTGNTFIMPAADVTITAVFTPRKYDISMSVEFANNSAIYANPASSTGEELTITKNGTNDFTLNGTITKSTQICWTALDFANVNTLNLKAGDKVRAVLRKISGSYTQMTSSKAEIIAEFTKTKVMAGNNQFPEGGNQGRVISAHNNMATANGSYSLGWDYINKNADGTTVRSTTVPASVISSAKYVSFWIWTGGTRTIKFEDYRLNLSLVKVTGVNPITESVEYDSSANKITVPTLDGY